MQFDREAPSGDLRHRLPIKILPEFEWSNVNYASTSYANSGRSFRAEFLAEPELAREVDMRSKPCLAISDGVLFRQGQLPSALYLIRSGEVALAMESGNRMVMCLRAGPGSLVGLPAVIGNKPYSMTAAPCAGADIREIGGPEFNDLIRENPVLAMKVLQVLAAEVRLTRRSYLEMISRMQNISGSEVKFQISSDRSI